MKKITLLLLACFVSLITSSFAQEGIWGGKWDDTWPVFVEVRKGKESGVYEVQYIWLENTEDPDFSRRDLPGRSVDNHFEAGFLIFKLNETSGTLYGAFRRPRMANLVKVDYLPSPLEADSILRKAGWKPGAIPAAEALEKIKKN